MENREKQPVLVDPAWVEEHLERNGMRIIDCTTDERAFRKGHVPGALRLDWDVDLTNPQTRDLIGKKEFEQLVRRLGIANDTTVVFYDDLRNLGACHAYWVFRYYGHEKARILNGGRMRWESEKRRLVAEVPAVTPTSYTVTRVCPEFRALRQDVLQHIGSPDPTASSFRIPNGHVVLDDRTPAEFDGKVETDAEYPLRTLRGGRIPGALNIPFSDLLDDHGTFHRGDEIKKILLSKGVTPDKDIVVYTRIGERSATTWFVLHDLLGYSKVRNYDGAFAEWGNMVGMPVEHAAHPIGPRVPQRAVKLDPERRAHA
ncbi:MAG TPA: sulfurtransferase [Thermoanaerobaculaceae bacterium]|nr:sulfurtransferase [Thermoanaerobaculaceae bacterium]